MVGEADGYIDLPVTLSAPGTSTVTVNYATPSGGGCNQLFQGQSGTLTFVPGVTLSRSGCLSTTAVWGSGGS